MLLSLHDSRFENIGIASAPLLPNMEINGSPAADGAGDPLPTLTPEASNSEVHSSTPETLKNQMSIEPPMKLPEVQAAAEHALLTSISDETLRKALSSVEGFEVNAGIVP